MKNEIIKIESDDLHKVDEKNTLNEHIFSFLGSKSPSTRKVYEGHLKEFFSFLDNFKLTDLKDVRYSHLIAYKTFLDEKNTIKKGKKEIEGKLSDNAKNIKLSTVKSFFKFLTMPLDNEGNSYLQNNVASHLKREKVDPYTHSQTFDKEVFLKIISNLREDDPLELRDKAILLMIAYTGLRKNEIINLKVNSLYEELGIAYYKVKGKNSKIIEKELPIEVYSLIKKLKERMELTDHDFLFQNLSNHRRESNQLSHSAINYILNHYAKKHGFTKRFRVHSLRSMSAKEVYETTKDILETQRHLNHSNIATTQIYLNKIGEGKKVSYYGKMFR